MGRAEAAQLLNSTLAVTSTKMNSSPESMIEERKLLLESKKLAVEQKKYELAKKGYYLDIFSKIALPLALGWLAWATYMSNTKAVEDRMTFDINVKQTELRQKEEELFLKKSDAERSKDSLKAAFIQTNFALIATFTPEARLKAEALAKVSFSSNELPDILLKMAQVRESASQLISSTPVAAAPSPTADYKTAGVRFVKANNYAQALQYFETATLLQPSDAEAWNFKAYAQMRTGNPEAALTSIETSIWLRPIDRKLQHYVMLNATKILCSLNRTADALTYLRKSIAAFPELSSIAQQETELKQRCNFTFGSN